MKSTLSFILFIFVVAAHAQTLTQTVKGRVIDTESRRPVVGASVSVLTVSPLVGASTDSDGFFKILNVPVGRHSLIISSIGYESTAIKELLVGSGKEIELNILLSESLQQLQEVTIKAQKEHGAPLNDMASVSARSFSVEQVKRFAAAINDPARMALTFAGVASNNDQSNALIIRGNTPKGVLWRMEGVEIPNPNHFAEEGATGGGISALSVNVLGNSDFFTGAFPAEYGNATSGVFDLKLRNGNNEKREYAAQVGVMGLDVAAEGPFSKNNKASYLVNYRYSTLEILKQIGVNPAGDATPNFQDMAFKLFFPVGNKHTLSLWGMGGLSKQLRDRTDRTDAFHSDRGVVGLNWVHLVSDKTFIDATLSWAASRSTYDATRKERVFIREQSYTNEAYRASFQINHKFNAQHALRVGGIVSNLHFNLLNRTIDGPKTSIFIDQKDDTHLLQGYAQWKFRASPALSLNVGFHATVLQLNGQSAAEPRLGMRWTVAPRHTLSAGFGVHSRTEAISTYFAQIKTNATESGLANKNLKLMKSRHYVLGYEYRPHTDWRLQVEVYYQQHYDLPIGPANTKNAFLKTFSLVNSLDGYSNDSLVSNGTGRNYGIDFSIEKSLTNGFYLMLNTSIYEAKYTAADGVERNSRFNGNFVQNLLLGKEWKVGKRKTNSFGLNLRSLWAGGNRYTTYDLAQAQKRNSDVRIWNQAYAEQIPHYFRMDSRVSYTKNRKKATYTISLDLQNLTNRLNKYDPYYSGTTRNYVFDTQLGLVPILNWRVEF
ncbi:MAG: TonB-dependent receptor [Cytophagia bacterium]|nr:MAG: TonB-dependent receptor [Cytophagales bacterium]TAG40448.1 MAG: TonB-dependent receptor [Cytophagia bacterium]TAG81997.1 MAG: TonB-dependent receptor [Cytophagales bacterium]